MFGCSVRTSRLRPSSASADDGVAWLVRGHLESKSRCTNCKYIARIEKAVLR